MPQFKVSVQWMETGEYDVEADTLEKAIAKVEDNENDYYSIGKANGEYLDDSFEVNRQVTEELNS